MLAVNLNDSLPYKAFMFIDDVWEIVASSNDPVALQDFMESYCGPDEYYEIVGW